MSKYVLDASALLAMLNHEPGADRVAENIASGAVISTVNLSEVIAKLDEAGVPESVIHDALDLLDLEVVGFDTALAYRAGLLRSSTRQAGLSLGDRSCLALAQHLNLPALTADRTWETLKLGVVVTVIR